LKLLQGHFDEIFVHNTNLTVIGIERDKEFVKRANEKRGFIR
jgi:hypothetical protein